LAFLEEGIGREFNKILGFRGPGRLLVRLAGSTDTSEGFDVV
jgi:hypothetical protein